MFGLKNLFYLLLSIVIVFYCNQTFSKTPEQIIQDSISQYPGKCPCPYSIMSNGKKCGKRSAYSKPGGYEPLCYVSDIFNKKNSRNVQTKIKIIDGDTIHINKIKYRLYGIDAPEMKQLCKVKEENYKCGVKSKDFLVSLIANQFVKCNKKDIDRYKRIVAECFVGQTNINKELVRNGWALAYRDYSRDFINDEEFAKKNKLGIWKGTFINPKKWRKLNR
jgi:endonuclease YncB( thermonuclease family)